MSLYQHDASVEKTDDTTFHAPPCIQDAKYDVESETEDAVVLIIRTLG